MAFTLTNVLLVVALVVTSMLFGYDAGEKNGRRNGRIEGINIGREETRHYLFNKMPKELVSKIQEEEYNRLMSFLNGDLDGKE